MSLKIRFLHRNLLEVPLEGLILGLVDGTLLARDDLGIQRQEALLASQAQLENLVALAVATFGMVEIATGAFDLASGPSLTGIINNEGALRSAPQVISAIDPPSQFTGQ